MKTGIIAILTFLAGCSSFSQDTVIRNSVQDTEFKTYSNGLIYSQRTMTRLGRIADSLNLKYKQCDAFPEYRSQPQALAHFIRLYADLDQAKKDMINQIPLSAFLQKYPLAIHYRDVMVTRHRYQGYQGKTALRFEQVSLQNGDGFSITSYDASLAETDMHNRWVFIHVGPAGNAKAYIEAFYFPVPMQSGLLPKQYNLAVGYADCMIDTSSTKMKNELKGGWVELPENWIALSDKKKNTLLDEMRGTRVFGQCSMDSRPREHAVNIALLSAETARWEVFLKAHLDIMNDRFERISDGNYAWGMRKTYITELENINIDVNNLIFGIVLRMSNPATNHYYGSIDRVGRALAESKNRQEFETRILRTIADSELDDYNRVLFYYLFLNYNYHLQDGKTKKLNEKKLQEAKNTLPLYLIREPVKT